MTLTLDYDPILSRVRVAAALDPMNSNPSFEADTTGWAASGGTIERSTDFAHDGVASLLITPAGGTSTSSAGFTSSGSPTVTPGRQYTFTAWVYTPSGYGAVSVDIDWLDASDDWVSAALGQVTAVAAATWTRLTVTGAAPAAAARASARVTIRNNPTTADRLYIDECKLLPGGTGVVQRSTNGITWSTIRGGTGLDLSDRPVTVDDYEFAPDVANYYRVRLVDGAGNDVTPPEPLPPPAEFVAASTATGNTTSLTVPLPTGWQPGELCLLGVAVNLDTVEVAVPDGWQPIAGSLITTGSMRCGLFWRVLEAGDTDPVVATSTQQKISAIAATYTGYDPAAPIASAGTWGVRKLTSTNTTTAPGVTTTAGDQRVVVFFAEKSSAATSVTDPAGTTRRGFIAAGGGGSVSTLLVDMVKATTGATGSFTATYDAASSAGAGVAVAINSEPLPDTGTPVITPILEGVWIKNVAKPWLNRRVAVVEASAIERPTRGGTFDVVGRTNPVTVTDVRASRRLELTILADTAQEANDLELGLSAGDVILLHVPPGCPLPIETMYAAVGDVESEQVSRYSEVRVLTLPLTETAAPGPDIVGTTITWSGVINAYSTWQALIDAMPTWGDVLEQIGAPGDVIVP